MLSLTQYRRNFYSIFKVMKDTGLIFDVIYRGKVYEVQMHEVDRKPVRNLPTKLKKPTLPHRIDIAECDTCGYVLMAGICMNTKCPTVTG